jgi:hypothetical protein
MLCSLNELGWTLGGPNEVAVFRDLRPGFKLEDLPTEDRPLVVKQWDRAIDEAETMTIASVSDDETPEDQIPDKVVKEVISGSLYGPPTTARSTPVTV